MTGLNKLCPPALLAAAALLMGACSGARIPDDHETTFKLNRAWKGLETGTRQVTLRTHKLDSGDYELRILEGSGSSAVELAYFPPAILHHDLDISRIQERPTSIRDTDTFIGRNDAGIMINGTITSEYYCHWVNGTAKDAFLVEAGFDVQDADGYVGRITGREIIDWN